VLWLGPVPEMSSPLRQRLIAALGPPVRLMVGGAYSLLFGWWFEKWSRNTFRKQLAREVRAELDFLFRRHGALFASNGDGPPVALGAVAVTIVVRTLAITVQRGLAVRGDSADDLTVFVAARTAPRDWVGLATLLRTIHHAELEREEAALDYSTSLRAVGRILVSHLDALEGAAAARLAT